MLTNQLLMCFHKVVLKIHAGKVTTTIFKPVLTFLHARFRSAAPVTPHVILLGPTGAGKSVQAAILTEKYQIVNGKSNEANKETKCGVCVCARARVCACVRVHVYQFTMLKLVVYHS